MNTYHVYTACVSPALNQSSALKHFECDQNMQWNNVRFLPRTATYIFWPSLHLSLSSPILPPPPGATNSTTECIFAPNSPLYTPEFRNTFRPIDGLVNSCENLFDYWEYLISLMSLSFMGLLMSVIAITSNCITPCVEERYNSWGKTDV